MNLFLGDREWQLNFVSSVMPSGYICEEAFKVLLYFYC